MAERERQQHDGAETQRRQPRARLPLGGRRADDERPDEHGQPAAARQPRAAGQSSIRSSSNSASVARTTTLAATCAPRNGGTRKSIRAYLASPGFWTGDSPL